MNKAKAIAGLLGMLVTLPIWFYLLYTVLKAIEADELTWFLFWVYMPVTFLVGGIMKIAEARDEK